MSAEENMDSLAWIQQDNEWPKSYTGFEGTLTIHVFGRDREDALKRLQQFEQFLERIAAPDDWNTPHQSTPFVTPRSGWNGSPTAKIPGELESYVFEAV